MNRRGFFSTLAKAAAAFAILPAATTYARAAWKSIPPFDPTKYAGAWDIDPRWITAKYEVSFLCDADTLALIEKNGGVKLSPDPYPIRYQRDPDSNLFVRVPKDYELH